MLRLSSTLVSEESAVWSPASATLVQFEPASDGTGACEVFVRADPALAWVSWGSLNSIKRVMRVPAFGQLKVALSQPVAGKTLKVYTVEDVGTVRTSKPAAPVVGQYKVTTSAASIGSGALVNGITLQALSTNAGKVFVGLTGVTTTVDGTGGGFILEAGSAVFLDVADVSAIFAVGTANDVLSWIGS